MALPLLGDNRRTSRVTAVMAVILTSVLLTGCGGSGDKKDPKAAQSSQGSSAAGGGKAGRMAAYFDCWRQHGVQLPEHPTVAQLQEQAGKLSAQQRGQIGSQCKKLLPAGLVPSGSASPSSTTSP